MAGRWVLPNAGQGVSGLSIKEETVMAKSSKRKRKARTPAKPYELTQRELAVGQEFLARCNKWLDSPRIKISKRDGVDKITYDHPMPMMGQYLLMEDLGITDFNFFDGLLGQLASGWSLTLGTLF